MLEQNADSGSNDDDDASDGEDDVSSGGTWGLAERAARDLMLESPFMTPPAPDAPAPDTSSLIERHERRDLRGAPTGPAMRVILGSLFSRYTLLLAMLLFVQDYQAALQQLLRVLHLAPPAAADQ